MYQLFSQQGAKEGQKIMEEKTAKAPGVGEKTERDGDILQGFHTT